MSTSDALLRAALADRYELLRELGRGGMATVYLARDVRHARQVAIKVLHPELAAVLGAERFLAEIKTTANLQHPHILPLFDSGSADGQLFYVMPFVEGETLRARLDRETQLPIADAVQLAREVADALQYAHERGVIHRDIKPENILLQGGHALVADFGIALAVQQAGGQRMTQTGLSLGTPQYMAPEQAMGEKAVDARADIYALGAVTYEMLAGEPPFTGPTPQAIIAKVMTDEPRPLASLRRTVPASVARTIARALQRLPADRYESARDFSQALVSAAPAPPHDDFAAAGGHSSRRLGSVGALALALALAAAAAGYWIGHRPTATTSSVRQQTVATLVPEPDEVWSGSGNSIAMSADGRQVAVVMQRGDRREIAIRSLDSLGSRRLPGTMGAIWPFWSRDGKSLAFFADGQLKVIDLASGAVRRLCAALDGQGGSWGEDDVILYVPENASAVYRTSPTASACSPLGVRQPPASMRSAGVHFLGDGRHFIVTTDLTVWLGRVGGDSLRWLTDLRLHRALAGGADYLLYKTSGTSSPIAAQRIDLAASRLVGQPIDIIAHVGNPGGLTALSASLNGSLVAFVSRDTARTGLMFVSREGVALDSVVIPAVAFGRIALSHDGRRLAAGGWGLFAYERATRSWTTLVPPQTSKPRTAVNPVWSPNDTAIAYQSAGSNGLGGDTVLIVDARGVRTRIVTGDAERTRRIVLRDWSPDGRSLLYTYGTGGGAKNDEAWLVDLVSGERRLLFTESADVGDLRVSPDGRFVAYELTAEGERAVFVRPFRSPGAAVRVSPSDGSTPRWVGREGELVYQTKRGELMHVRIDAAGRSVATPSIALRPAAVTLAGRGLFGNFDASALGDLFVVSRAGSNVRQLAVVLDWWSRMGASR